MNLKELGVQILFKSKCISNYNILPSTINTNKFTDGTASLESGELSGLNKLSVYDITGNNNVTISGN